MSTRGCIARLTSKIGAKKIKFFGVYAHWDNYPNGTGSTLFQLRNGHFKKNTKAMLKCLIDDHKAGWSTINNADFNLPAAPRPSDNLRICKHCDLPNWRHYAQYYNEGNTEWVKAGKPICPPHSRGSYLVTGHSPEYIDAPHGPECFTGEGELLTQDSASSCGCEYVYAFTPDGKTMLVLSSYCEDGHKMIGMFGCGDPKVKWKVIGEINLNGKEPTKEQWGKIPIKQGGKESSG